MSKQAHTVGPPRAGSYVDPRGPRFGAWITVLVLVAVLLTSSGWLIAAQTAVFATGAIFGLAKAPYGLIFRSFVRPRLDAPVELEAQAPPRFAQGLGAGFGLIATIGFAIGIPGLGLVFTGFALVAALLNAAFGICLGCEVYLFARRLAGRESIARFVPAPRQVVSA